tara:strand:- start:35871 stop:36107 length:237 start_codon:yes stop_codon:yes gene_type:complete
VINFDGYPFDFGALSQPIKKIKIVDMLSNFFIYFSYFTIKYTIAEGEGFEPPKSFPLPVFKTGAISQALPPLQIDYST